MNSNGWHGQTYSFARGFLMVRKTTGKGVPLPMPPNLDQRATSGMIGLAMAMGCLRKGPSGDLEA